MCRCYFLSLSLSLFLFLFFLLLLLFLTAKRLTEVFSCYFIFEKQNINVNPCMSRILEKIALLVRQLSRYFSIHIEKKKTKKKKSPLISIKRINISLLVSIYHDIYVLGLEHKKAICPTKEYIIKD